MSDSGKDRTTAEIERLSKELEAETAARLELQRQLDRANADFEEFISIAAHNLREPLRDVAAFSQLLAEAYGARLDSDAGMFFGRILGGAARMQSLLADMVDYWELRTSGEPSSTADMEAVLRQVLLCADKQMAERSAVVTHDPLPQVCGDFAILTKVLHHLIKNAVEYCDNSSPRVHISSKQMDLHWVISVHDNGPGIDPAFQGRVFGVFKRLHGKAYPGNGLGLAFCKKAIAGYGGRIWVEPTPGAGSTFCFTLAAPAPRDKFATG
jgi:light-regulated signal transduction histidine kinase (bacteriophytochrome)